MKRPRIPTPTSNNFVKVFSTDKLSEQASKNQNRRIENFTTKKSSDFNFIEFRDSRY